MSRRKGLAEPVPVVDDDDDETIKNEIITKLHWINQVMAILIGVLAGYLPLNGFVGFARCAVRFAPSLLLLRLLLWRAHLPCSFAILLAVCDYAILAVMGVDDDVDEVCARRSFVGAADPYCCVL